MRESTHADPSKGKITPFSRKNPFIINIAMDKLTIALYRKKRLIFLY